MTGRRLLPPTLFSLLAAAVLSAAGTPIAPPPGPPPEWVPAYMADAIGTWVTDNRAYRSEQEPADAYGIEWSWGLGRRSLVGRLYGLQNGREIGTFWEFREYWHPADGQLVTSQFGADGTVGIGPHTRLANGSMEMVQRFSSPDGREWRTAHRSERRGDELTTRSFDVGPDGTWTDRRVYTWRRTK
jgi:hypothetical protein